MKGAVLGIDTSCYTTSVACFGETGVLYDGRTLLPVQKGDRGLRQSEGVFLHTRQLPPLVEAVFSAVAPEDIRAVACSRSPVDRADSYMPVFLTGLGVARALAASLQVPLLSLDHQSGHIRAALIGNESLMDKPFYAVHLSGGTTDLLAVEAKGPGAFSIEPLGRSEDLHAGQLVDRVGVLLGCGFPAGKEMESLARQAADRDVRIPASVRALTCSLSGAENGVQRALDQGRSAAEVAYGIYDLLARTLTKLLTNAAALHGERPVLLCGGVASSLLLRQLLHERCDLPLFFSESRYSSDNAVGVAALGFDREADV
ncbi:MAG: O-sialoglycoprotein endopeptidase [Clostridia bacterium]|nr:O-sialoglycoprotein endopeptidase [Clostridia bacterium]